MIQRPERLLFLAFFLLLFGCVMPFLMVLKIVESTFLMNFLSFIASTLGFFLGIIGIAVYQGKLKKRSGRQFEDMPDE